MKKTLLVNIRMVRLVVFFHLLTFNPTVLKSCYFFLSWTTTYNLFQLHDCVFILNLALDEIFIMIPNWKDHVDEVFWNDQNATGNKYVTDKFW